MTKKALIANQSAAHAAMSVFRSVLSAKVSVETEVTH